MSTLFEIENDFKILYNMATDPECDDEVFRDSLEALTGELEVKSAGYVYVIKQLEMEAKQADEVSKEFANKKKLRENRIKRMKDSLKAAMETAGLPEIDTGNYTIKVQKNGGIKPLVIDGDVPDNMTKITVEPDNAKIREFLKNNTCDWAHLVDLGTHIVIR